VNTYFREEKQKVGLYAYPLNASRTTRTAVWEPLYYTNRLIKTFSDEPRNNMWCKWLE